MPSSTPLPSPSTPRVRPDPRSRVLRALLAVSIAVCALPGAFALACSCRPSFASLERVSIEPISGADNLDADELAEQRDLQALTWSQTIFLEPSGDDLDELHLRPFDGGLSFHFVPMEGDTP
jgi:hypothetical protein